MADETPSTPLFSYWRPLIGWISAVGFGLQFIVFPIITTIFSVFGHAITLPSIDITTMIAMVTTTMGIGGMRSYEKVNGVSDQH